MKKQIIVLHGKHDREYFDASTPEAENSSLQKILKINRDNYYYNELEDAGFIKEKQRLNDSIQKIGNIDLNTIPDSLKAAAEKEIQNAKRYQRQLQELTKEKELFDKAVSGDAVAVKRFLLARSTGEYEHISYQTLQ